ncbi:MAG: hypothetical protein ACJAWL_003447 [Motiliproteus sp.]
MPTHRGVLLLVSVLWVESSQTLAALRQPCLYEAN